MTQIISNSLINSVNKYYRLRNNIETRKNSLEIEMLGKGNYQLFKKSGQQKRLTNLISRLDYVYTNAPTEKRETIYKEIYQQWKCFGNLEEHLKWFGIKIGQTNNIEKRKKSDFIEVGLDEAKKNIIESRKNIINFRLLCEAQEKTKNGFFCIFNTLTVEASHYEEVFKQGSKAFKNYTKKIKDAIKKALCGSRRNFIGSDTDIYSHFAVTEEGTKTGRNHIHCVHFIKTLPVGSYDPNSEQDLPYLREIGSFKKYWKYGFSSPIAVRFNDNDAYAKRGWKWPTNKNGTPIKQTNTSALINYVSKYITKNYEKRRTQIWRIKITDQLGMNQIMTMLETLTPLALKKAILDQPQTRLWLDSRLIPRRLIYKTALKMWIQKSKKIIQRIYAKSIKTIKRLKTLPQQLKDMTQNTWALNQPNIGNIKMLVTKNDVAFNILSKIQQNLDMIYLGIFKNPRFIIGGRSK